MRSRSQQLASIIINDTTFAIVIATNPSTNSEFRNRGKGTRTERAISSCKQKDGALWWSIEKRSRYRPSEMDFSSLPGIVDVAPPTETISCLRNGHGWPNLSTNSRSHGRGELDPSCATLGVPNALFLPFCPHAPRCSESPMTCTEASPPAPPVHCWAEQLMVSTLLNVLSWFGGGEPVVSASGSQQ